MRDNIIQEKSYTLALEILSLVRKLPKSMEGYVLGKQLIRSGTSIGANVEEAIAGYSKSDFTHKMSIARKEARETHYWLRLIKDGHLIACDNIDEIIENSEEIIKILTSIVKTAQAKNS